MPEVAASVRGVIIELVTVVQKAFESIGSNTTNCVPGFGLVHPAGRANPRLMKSAAAFTASAVVRSRVVAFDVCELPAGISASTLNKPIDRIPIEISTSIRLMPRRS